MRGSAAPSAFPRAKLFSKLTRIRLLVICTIYCVSGGGRAGGDGEGGAQPARSWHGARRGPHTPRDHDPAAALACPDAGRRGAVLRSAASTAAASAAASATAAAAAAPPNRVDKKCRRVAVRRPRHPRRPSSLFSFCSRRR